MFPEKWKSADWHESEECYVTQEGDIFRIGNSLIERALSQEGGRLRTVAVTNKITGHTWTLNTNAEARATFAASSSRIEIPLWRYSPGTSHAVDPDEDAGFRQGFHRPDLIDTDWQSIECFTSIGEKSDPAQPGYGWFRTTFELPGDAQGQPIGIAVGGYDNEDWQYYRVFVNGEEAGTRELSGRWREPTPFVLDPDHPGYKALKFGGQNVLAVQAGRMNKLTPEMDPAESVRYFFRSRLVDQFVTVGVPTKELSDFRLKEYWPAIYGLPPANPTAKTEAGYYPLRHWASGGDRDWMWCMFWAEDEAANVQVIYHFQIRSGEPLIRKKVEVRNLGDEPKLLLDIDVEDFQIDGTTTEGGHGYPVLLDDQAFCALEHPAGVNQGLGDAVRLRHFPGLTLVSEQGTMSKESVLGVTEAGQAREGFLDYLRKKGRRQERWVSVYDPPGITDGYMNPHHTRYHVTEQMVLDSIDMLDRLRAHGITMDYYFIDVGWQDHFTDLKRLHADRFPNGATPLLKRLDDIGAEFGLWFSTTYAPWSCGDYPPVQKSMTPNGSRGAWGAGGLCMAAEPYRTIFRDAILHHVIHNRVRSLKFDMARYYCNSTEHGHLPGKYSVEAQFDSMVETARAVTEVCPDVFIIWYWGHVSPFWMLYGDTIQDKGLKGEAVAVSSYPSGIYRASVTLNQDQFAQYAKFLPLIVHDSLGIWIGDMPHRNRIGVEHWQDAWIMDTARGSLFNQPWGTLSLFEAEDVDFYAEWYDFMRENWRLYLNTRPVIGNPAKGEVYGYAGGLGDHAIVSVNNPTFEPAEVCIRLDEEIALRPTNVGFVVRQRHREHGIIDPPSGSRFAYGDEIALSVRPFEVVVLEIGENLDVVGWPTRLAPQIVQTRHIEHHAEQVSAGAVSLETPPPPPYTQVAGHVEKAISGRLRLPEIDSPSTLAIITRQSRDGIHWYHKEIHRIIKLRAWVGDQELDCETVPEHWVASGPGSPWLVFKLPIQPDHGGHTVRFEVLALLPEDVECRIETLLYHEWWSS